jgi:hypothetical protein
MCLKIELDKRGMNGDGMKNRGRKDTYNEFNLYFECRNLCGTAFKSENPSMFKKKDKIARVKPIVVPRGLRNDHPVESKHIEKLLMGDDTSKQAFDVVVWALRTLEDIIPRARKKKFAQLNIILVGLEYVSYYDEFPFTIWQEAMDIAFELRDMEA